MKYFLLAASAALISGASARTLTVANACPFTIWPAMFTDLNVSLNVPNFTTGWEAPSGSQVSFTVPDNWKAGRIWGVPPATVAEWTLDGDGFQDFVDVSVVDGFNLPMRITNNGGCPVADCPVDLVPNCPDALKGPFDSTGLAVGCKSACEANLDGNPSNSANCCTGSHNTPATCPSSGVAFYSYFKGNCPNAYAYAYDETSSLWVCNSKPDYTLTFCP